jgi:succinyl-diaminopimelate desuccinylase
MKGGIAASVIAAEAFLDTHPDFSGAIEISATADEESGGYGGVAYLGRTWLVRPRPRAARHHSRTAEQGPHLPRPSRCLVGRDRDKGPDRPWLHAFPRRLRRPPHGRRSGRDGGDAVPASGGKRTEMPVVPEGRASSTLNINAIHGGEPEQDADYTGLPAPCVPDRCRITIDRRFLIEEDIAEVKAEVAALMERSAPSAPASTTRSATSSRCSRP